MLFEPFPDLRKDQQAIANSKARFKVVACGRRWGKTTLGLIIAIREARAGKRVWWVAPTYHLAFHPWRYIKAALTDEWDAKTEKEYHIDLPGGGSITVASADDPDSLRGVGLDYVVIDEAAFMSEEAWTAALRPALSDRKGGALIISTPRGHNWFWRAWQNAHDEDLTEWASWQAPSSENPIVGETEIIEARKTLPERIFRQEFEAEFLEDGGSVFHSVRKAATAPAEPQPVPGHRYLMGLDFGRYEDFTAAVVIDATTCEMVEIDRFNEIEWSLQHIRIAALARRWNVESVMAESNSIGEPNIEALRRMGVPVMAFVTTRASKPPLIEGLVSAIQNRELLLLPDDLMLDELEAFSYKNTETGTIYSAPPGKHDDTVIALALAWHAATVPRLALGIAEV